jgi:hypothetical protein
MKRRQDPFRRRHAEEIDLLKWGTAHVYGKNFRCKTDTLGYATPDNANRTRLVLDNPGGFIPLWAKNTTLRWRFQEQSLVEFADAASAKAAIRDLLGKALLLWGDAVPVKFAERKDAWDFEVAVRAADDCDINGCVLASAFFPDAGQHELQIYPKLFGQDRIEQVETLAHELGHVFGLRHFFAKIYEKRSPSVIYGRHRRVSIMNYGPNSKLTKYDRADLKRLYELVWSGQLTKINGTPVRLFRPFHAA